MSDFPTAVFSAKQDAKKFGVRTMDNSASFETDGGYTMTRPRTTRKPLREWRTGFTGMSQAQYEAFQTFWDARLGGSKSFNWIVPTSGEIALVRFSGEPEIEYIGEGGTFLYDVSVTLREV